MSETSEVYLKLREQLNQYSIGFPTTESGVEIRLLQKLFTEEEAELFLIMTMMVETPEAIAQRTGRDPGTVASMLRKMTDKGLIFRLGKGDEAKYGAVPFVLGSYEFQAKTIDKEFAELFEQYFQEAFHKGISEGGQIMRPVPVNRSVDVSYSVATYEDSREIVKSQKLIAVTDCLCRSQQKLVGKGCDKPLEVCLMFGAGAQYFLDRGTARRISVDEALKILDISEEAGLVPQPTNDQNPSAICNCCGCCCGLLRALKKHPHPARIVVSNYYAVVDPDECTGCETCLERCQMEAVSIGEDDTAVVDLNLCIGCGLCVTTCPTEAIHLELKSEDQRLVPPERARQTVMEIAKKRGTSLIPIALSK